MGSIVISVVSLSVLVHLVYAHVDVLLSIPDQVTILHQLLPSEFRPKILRRWTMSQCYIANALLPYPEHLVHHAKTKLTGTIIRQMSVYSAMQISRKEFSFAEETWSSPPYDDTLDWSTFSITIAICKLTEVVIWGSWFCDRRNGWRKKKARGRRNKDGRWILI